MKANSHMFAFVSACFIIEPCSLGLCQLERRAMEISDHSDWRSEATGPASNSGLLRGTAGTPDKFEKSTWVTTPNSPESALRGVNLSGGEFGKVPGKLGHDYIYPSNSLIDQVRERGFGLVRIPFRWERVQPLPYGDLSASDLSQLRRVTEHANALGMVVVLDLHNYARRSVDSRTETVGTPALPAAALADFWEKLGSEFKDQDNIWIGLMNEPHGLSADRWWAVAQEVVNRLRARSINNVLLVPGTRWSGAWSWKVSGNAQEAEAFSDPQSNTIFEVHQYLDADSSGTSNECSTKSAERVDDVIDWAETGRHKLFFGEIAAGSGANCEREYTSMLQRLNVSNSVVAWAAWGGGAWWPESYPFRLTFDQQIRQTPHDQYLFQTMKQNNE